MDVVCGDGGDGACLVCGDDGGVFVLALEGEWFGYGEVFVVGAVVDVDGVVGGCVGDGVCDVLVGVVDGAVPGSLGVVDVDVDDGLRVGVGGEDGWCGEEDDGEDGGEWGVGFHGGVSSLWGWYRCFFIYLLLCLVWCGGFWERNIYIL